MIVATLIERLQQLDPNLPLYLSQDEEGNGFTRLDCVDEYLTPSPAGYMLDGLLCSDDLEEIAEYEPGELSPVAVLWP
jgi:hypothetical protein